MARTRGRLSESGMLRRGEAQSWPLREERHRSRTSARGKSWVWGNFPGFFLARGPATLHGHYLPFWDWRANAWRVCRSSMLFLLRRANP
jgi:hypothetical protein